MPVKTLAVDSDILNSLALYSAILGTKMFLTAVYTVVWRFRKKTFANPEDASTPGSKVSYADPDVERVRRAHLNDLENILPFFALAPLYVFTTQPAYATALTVFRIFTAARITHTFVYIGEVPQPARAIAHLVALGANVFMAGKIIANFAPRFL